MNNHQPMIVVRKSAGELRLYDGSAGIHTYRCITGTYPGDKQRQGDRITPLGKFLVVYKNPQSKFHLSLGLNYPTLEDAQRGLATRLIDAATYQALVYDILCGDMNDPAVQDRVWNTPLGGEIFIHGGAEGRTHTAGCVAVTNADITEIYNVCPVGTPVEILP